MGAPIPELLHIEEHDSRTLNAVTINHREYHSNAGYIAVEAKDIIGFPYFYPISYVVTSH